MKLAIVNDSLPAREGLQRLLRTRSDCELLWTAENGPEAIDFCQEKRPDIILMDMVMPGMDGAEVTRRILAQHTCAILIVTASIFDNASKIFEAMGAGALDVAVTPCLSRPGEVAEFFRKLDQIQRLHGSEAMGIAEKHAQRTVNHKAPQTAILIGASAGGPTALASILSTLSPELPVGIVIAQHMDSRFDDAFISWLNDQSSWPVRKAISGDEITSGQVLVAGANRHLVFTPSQQLGFSDQPQFAYIPSIDVLFASAARYWRGKLAGVVLTGMGSDGAKGLQQLKEAGHLTLAQDKDSSALYGMPKVAAEAGAASEILPLNRISDRLARYVSFITASSS
jgi:two-component system, chemotaxis family, response regulator WspF